MTGDPHDHSPPQGAGPGPEAKKPMPLLIKVFLALCVVLLLLDFVIHRHVAHPWEHLFGFYAFYGFVACVLLVLTATQLRKVVMRNEDYYDAD